MKLLDRLNNNSEHDKNIGIITGESKDSEDPKKVVGYVESQLQRHADDKLERLYKYSVLEDFINGRHWGSSDSMGARINRDIVDYGLGYSNRRPDDAAQITYNKCGPVTEKFLQFLAIHKLQPHVQKPAMFDVSPAQSPKDRAEEGRFTDEASQLADNVEKIGRSIWFKDNDWTSVGRKWAEYTARLGEGFMRSVWDPQKQQIVKTPVDPRYVTAWFKDNTHEDLAGVIYEASVDIETVKMDVKDGGLNKDGKLNGLAPGSRLQAASERSQSRNPREKETDIPMYDVWIDLSTYKNGKFKPRCRNIIIVGDQLIKDETINDPFPYYLVRFQEIPGYEWGQAAVQQGIPLQRRLNESLSDEAEIIKMYAAPWIIEEGTGQALNDIIGSVDGPKVIPIAEGGDIRFLQWQGSLYNVTQHIDRISKAFDDVVGMPAIAYGNFEASLATGVALTTSFQPTIQKIQDWSKNFEKALNKMWRDDLMRMENHAPKLEGGLSPADLVQGNYDVSWEWGERAPRDESLYTTNVINKKNAGLLSDKTAMEKLGIPSPNDEQKQIEFEKNNAFLNPEIALQKFQAFMQWEQMVAQAAQQQQQQVSAQGGGQEGIPGNQGGQAFNSAAPNLTPNLADVAQPFAQPGAGGGSNQAPQDTEA